MVADWLAECHYDIVRIFETARELCHWPAQYLTNETGHSPFEEEVFSLCGQSREVEVDYALNWFNRAYYLQHNTLVVCRRDRFLPRWALPPHVMCKPIPASEIFTSSHN